MYEVQDAKFRQHTCFDVFQEEPQSKRSPKSKFKHSHGFLIIVFSKKQSFEALYRCRVSAHKPTAIFNLIAPALVLPTCLIWGLKVQVLVSNIALAMHFNFIVRINANVQCFIVVVIVMFLAGGSAAISMGRFRQQESSTSWTWSEAFCNFYLAHQVTAIEPEWVLMTAGPKSKLDDTVYSQPALFIAGLAAVERLKSEQPDAVRNCSAAAGLSLGEYTALVFAGAMTFEDGIKVDKRRQKCCLTAVYF